MASKPSKAKRKQLAAKQAASRPEPQAQAAAAPLPEQAPAEKPGKAAAKTEAKLPPLGKITPFERLQCWCAWNYIYILAFFIPVALTYLAYALFGMYPFGPESVLCLDLNGQYVY